MGAVATDRLVPDIKSQYLAAEINSLRMPEMVAEMSLSTTSNRDDSAVMKVVIPHRVKAVAVLVDVADEGR